MKCYFKILPEIPNPAKKKVRTIPEGYQSILAEENSFCSVGWFCELCKHNASHASLQINHIKKSHDKPTPDLNDDSHNTLTGHDYHSYRTLLCGHAHSIPEQSRIMNYPLSI